MCIAGLHLDVGSFVSFSIDCLGVAEGFAFQIHEVAGTWFDCERALGWDFRVFRFLSIVEESQPVVIQDDDFTIFKQYDEPVTVEKPTVDPDMGYLGPEFGGAAGEIASALEALAASDPDAFEGEEVAVEVDSESVTVPVDQTGFSVEEITENGEHITPHVVEPSFGVGRLIYTVLAHAYREDEVDGEERTYLELPPEQAPTTVGVFPLMDRDGLGEYARELAEGLRQAGHSVTYDDSGAIGRRYRRQDEIGTPYCVTVDYESLDEDTVTLRERDTTAQKRVSIDGLAEAIDALVDGDVTFDEL